MTRLHSGAYSKTPGAPGPGEKGDPAVHYLGTDVSKATLEVSDSEGGLHSAFSNSPSGHNKLVRWVKRHLPGEGVLMVIEPTSTYHERLVTILAQAGIGHVLVSPLRARRYAGAIGLRAKTDRVDARTLARMGEREGLCESRLPEEGKQRLRALRRHREWLEDEASAVRNRLGAAEASPYTPSSVLRTLRRLIRDLEGQAEETAKEIERTVGEDRALSTQAQLLASVPGIGMKTAVLILTELPAPGECKDSRSWPAFCGVTPRTVQSGASSYSVLSRAGRPDLRARLYMAAVVSMRFNPAVSAYAARLAARGKTGKKAVVASMHKLLRICFGVLKNSKPFDPGMHLKNT